VIGIKGVHVHQEKIQSILDWPTPRSVTELQGFFELCSYYRRIVKGFSQLGVPLTDLNKKGAFRWLKEAQESFDRMKKVVSTCPVLALPNFTQPFVLDCDTSEEGI
jgi:hypothetical protein